MMKGIKLDISSSKKKSVSVDVVQKMVMSGDLPQVLNSVLSHLPVADVCTLSTVCRTWDKLANENQLWRALCHRDQVSLPQDMVIEEQVHQGHWCHYKSVYKKYTETLRTWKTGEGVGTFSKTLFKSVESVVGNLMSCLAVCSRYVLTYSYDIFAHGDCNIYVYCAVTGVYSHLLTGLPCVPKYAVVSTDETMAVAHSRRGTVVCVWKLDTGELMGTFDHPAAVHKMAVHDSALAVGMSGDYPAVFLWSIESGQLVRQLCCTDPEVLVMDGQHIVIHNRRDSVVQLWDAVKGTHCFTCNQANSVDVMLDKATKLLVIKTGDALYLWDTETGLCRARVPLADDKWYGLARYKYKGMLVHDGTLVIGTHRVHSAQGTLSLVDLRAAEPVQSMLRFVNVGGGMRVLRAVCNGLVVMCGTLCMHARVTLWDIKQRRFVRTIHAQPDKPTTDINFITVSLAKLQLVRDCFDSQINLQVYDFSVPRRKVAAKKRPAKKRPAKKSPAKKGWVL